jgi:hypothetical protein
MAQPSQTPDWNTGGSNRTDPPSGQKISGWTVNQTPPSSYFNWWMNLVYQWVLYLKNLTTEALTWGAFQTFNAALRGFGTNLNPGVRGDSGGSGFAGVRGHSVFTGVGEHGVLGTHQTTGTGVKGETATGIGAHGDASGSGAGVKGSSNTGLGVYATSNSGIALSAASTSNIGAVLTGGTIALSVGNQPGSGGDSFPAVAAYGSSPNSLYPGKPAISAFGGGIDDPADAQVTASASAILAQGGNAYGNDSIAPAIANQNAGHGVVARGGATQGEFNDGRPGTGVIAYGGDQIDLAFNDTIGGVGLKAVAGTGAGGRGNAIEADGVIEVNDKIRLTGSSLAASVGQTNEISPGLVVKAWARIRISSGTYTLQAGQNVTSVVAGGSPTTGQFKINLAAAIPRASRCIIVHSDVPSHAAHAYDDTAVLGASNTVVTFEVVDRLLTSTINLTTNTVRLHVMILGIQ